MLAFWMPAMSAWEKEDDGDEMKMMMSRMETRWRGDEDDGGVDRSRGCQRLLMSSVARTGSGSGGGIAVVRLDTVDAVDVSEIVGKFGSGSGWLTIGG